jgi:hypothetical protein
MSIVVVFRFATIYNVQSNLSTSMKSCTMTPNATSDNDNIIVEP